MSAPEPATPKPANRDPDSLSGLAGARREEILDAALHLFSRRGFHDTSISQIAAGTGISRSAIYQYFHDKRDILIALAQRVEEQMVAAIDAWEPLPAPPDISQEDPEDLKTQLRAMIDMRIGQFLVTATAQNMAGTRLVLRSLRGHHDELREATRRIEAHVLAVVTKDVRAAIRFGWARECDPEPIAIFLLGGIEKLLFRALDAEEASEVDQAALIRETGQFIFFGLACAALRQGISPSGSLPPESPSLGDEPPRPEGDRGEARAQERDP
jgi:AcrR family transcriptional regulator